MAPMGIRLSPLGVAVFCLLGLGVIYHLYAGVISSRIAAFTSKRTVNLRDLLALSVEAAVQGGREVKRVREEDKLEEKTKGKTKEGASEKLTQGDLNSHRKMYYLIKNTYPYVQVNSEEHDETNNELGVWNRDIPADILKSVEGGRDVPADSITIWIDPLDATQEYTAWALVGHGSNMKPRTTYNMNPPKVIVSRSHAGKVKGFIEEAFGNTTVILPAGGAGYKVLALLDPLDEDIEKADVYIHVTFIKKWDICAGNALLTALGGHMTTLKGEEIDYSGAAGNREGLLASVKVDHQDLVAKLPAWDSSDKH
ncbi:inositol monophosphatase 3 isoform X2 [Salvelinus sp. IW2-2015]|uniref:inositol monophosphatase 3 isoform X2 n=1 Tax=Salvelinus sp. IW2-2015 TaxID=2691554 RepID=UPI000CDFA4E0|nr:inositol monophosphatase 3 isoform X2 [Salvelinus alpinus]